VLADIKRAVAKIVGELFFVATPKQVKIPWHSKSAARAT
jgi:hypothetical protein